MELTTKIYEGIAKQIDSTNFEIKEINSDYVFCLDNDCNIRFSVKLVNKNRQVQKNSLRYDQ